MKRIKTKNAFTLVEILIVVCILGIVAAIVAPHYSKSTTKAKEAAAKETLQMLRTTIERYAIKTNGVPPGYFEDNPEGSIMNVFVYRQLVVEGKYINQLPKNPFNDSNLILMIRNNEDFPVNATGDRGWIYKPFTKDIRLDWPGTDSTGTLYYDY